MVNVALSAYEADLARLERVISCTVEGGGTATAGGCVSLLRALLAKAHLTGRPAAYEEADAATTAALTRYPRWSDLWLVRARLDLHFHRVDAAERDLEMLADVRESPEVLAAAAALAHQRGPRDEAETLTRRLVDEHRSWEALSRLAEIRAEAGDREGGLALYRQAAEEVTAKEMRAFAWIAVQAARLSLALGDRSAAVRAWRVANAAYHGYWVIERFGEELRQLDLYAGS